MIEKTESKCWVVTCLPCDHSFPGKESPEGCANCGMMDWLPAFDTEEECNAAYKKEHPEEFVEPVEHVSIESYDTFTKN